MPNRNISLTARQDAFVQRAVKAGEYRNASEAVRDALRVLRHRRREDRLRLKALRARTRAGVDALSFAADDPELEGRLEEIDGPFG